MTATTSGIVATNCVIKLDNNAGALVDISGQSNRVEIQLQNTIAEFRPFSTEWKSRAQVGKDAPVTLSGVWSSNDAEARGILMGWWSGGVDTARTLEIYAPDETGGSDKISGEFVLGNFQTTLDSEADDFVRWTAELMPHGAVTHAEVGS